MSCMIYPMVPFPVTLSDPSPRFQGHSVIFMPIDALSVFCAQLMRDLLAIAKFLFNPGIGRCQARDCGIGKFGRDSGCILISYYSAA